VTTDCHDASNPGTSGRDPNGNAPKCWAGGKLQGAQVFQLHGHAPVLVT
jgi:hypothetical protein